MATHCRIPAWELPWTEEPGGLQSVGRKELDTKERLNNKSKSSGNTHITCFEARGHFCYQVENCYNLKDGFSLGGRVCILSTIPVPHVDRRTKKSCPARTPAQACGGAPHPPRAKSLQSCPTLRYYGLQPSRLLWPRDFPGKSTGVGCHFLLQGIVLTQGLNLCLLHLLH